MTVYILVAWCGISSYTIGIYSTSEKAQERGCEFGSNYPNWGFVTRGDSWIGELEPDKKFGVRLAIYSYLLDSDIKIMGELITSEIADKLRDRDIE